MVQLVQAGRVQLPSTSLRETSTETIINTAIMKGEKDNGKNSYGNKNYHQH